MKIIMHGVTSNACADTAYWAVQCAIKDNIQKGRRNFKTYYVSHTGCQKLAFNVCKNKNSFTVYQEG